MSACPQKRTFSSAIGHVCFVPKTDVSRWQPNLTSSGRGRRPHSRRILDDRASVRLYHCPIVRADNLKALIAKSRSCKIR
jgi:hypothetical protein